MPLRPAVCGASLAVEPRASNTLDEARVTLAAAVRGWPGGTPRLAIEGGTGLGKTTAAVARCADHVVGPALARGQVLFVAHDRGRVAEIVALVRAAVARRGGDPTRVSDLLGRQRVPDDGSVRFGCRDHVRAARHGRRGRRVEDEVCGTCTSEDWCRAGGYLGHTKEAAAAGVVVATLAKLRGLSDAQWDAVGAVLCDEDVLPGLFGELTIRPASLLRALRHVRRVARKLAPSRSETALLRVRPLVEGILHALGRAEPGTATALVDLLPEECERFHTAEGHAELRCAMPRSRVGGSDGRSASRADPHAPAPFERCRGGKVPPQVWGRLLDALCADLVAGDSRRCATVRVERDAAGGRPALVVRRVEDRVLAMLRARPLLALDATMHPAAHVVLDAEHRRIDYDQGRTVVQVLGPLLRPQDLVERRRGLPRLSTSGRAVVAKLAAWFDGRRGHVLVRKTLRAAFEVEAARFDEMRRVEFVSPGGERGWDASPRALVFADVGRHAKPSLACEAEARALRSFMRRQVGSTALLDRLERGAAPLRFVGRGRAVRYRGELVERVTRQPDDRLAAMIQDAHRVATVRQFIGRDRTGRAEVLLLRGDPTVAMDALVALEDLPEAVPTARRRLVGGRTVP